LKKFFKRAISRHLFSYLLICFAYIYSINKFDHVPSFLSALFILFVFIYLAESTYQQYQEDKATGKKHQTFKQFIHNVNWPIVITVVFICIALYAALVFLTFII
jgi:4-hydroxybenzoate polyprenyltransferase